VIAVSRKTGNGSAACSSRCGRRTALAADSSFSIVALEHDLRVRRHLEVDGLRLHELDRLPAQEAGEHELVDVLRQRRARGVRRHRIEPERDRDLDLPVGGEVVRAPVLVDLPVHVRRPGVDLLHAVHADVAHARARVLRDHRRQGDERRGVAGPAALDRQQVEIDVVAGEHDVVHGAGADRARTRVGDRLQLLQPTNLLDEALRRLHLEQVAEPRRDVVEPLDAERHRHAPFRAELVDQQRMPRALDVLEQQRGPAGLHDAVVDLRDLEVGVDLGVDADELAFALEQRDPVAEVGGRGRHRGQSRSSA
jgi:hypothetical protein